MRNDNYHQESKERDSSESGNELTLLSGQGTESDKIHEVELVCGCGKSRSTVQQYEEFSKVTQLLVLLSPSPLVLSPPRHPSSHQEQGRCWQRCWRPGSRGGFYSRVDGIGGRAGLRHQWPYIREAGEGGSSCGWDILRGGDDECVECSGSSW